MKNFQPQEIIQTLQTVLNIDQNISGLEYFNEIAKNIAQTFKCKYVIIGHAVKPVNETVQTDVVWSDTGYHENFTYQLKGTPCENVISGNRVCIYPEDVANQFPEDKLLVEMGLESYVGAPMISREGNLTGLIIMLDVKPVEDTHFYSSVIEFLAMRIGAELDRHYIEEYLKYQVDKRTKELELANKELQKALSEIETLQGIIPICSNCKKVRDDRGYWQQVESYVTKHSKATFSHSVCPQCVEKYYKDLTKLQE